MEKTPVLERVKQLAKKQGISIVELEEKLGFGRNSLYAWKNKMPSNDKLIKVADYFNVSLDYLVGRDVKNEIDSNAYFRMDSDNLNDDEIEELKKQLKFAEALALQNIRNKKE